MGPEKMAHMDKSEELPLRPRPMPSAIPRDLKHEEYS